jgi:hypothetical protein
MGVAIMPWILAGVVLFFIFGNGESDGAPDPLAEGAEPKATGAPVTVPVEKVIVREHVRTKRVASEPVVQTPADTGNGDAPDAGDNQNVTVIE